MTRLLPAAMLFALGAGPALSGPVCVQNAAAEALIFAVETREGARQLAPLAPGETLCSQESGAADGIVSVYETPDGFEGCSRVIPTGSTAALNAFAAFDRCVWTESAG